MPPVFDDVCNGHTGYSCVQKGKVWGGYDWKTRSLTIQPHCESLPQFCARRGCTAVKVQGKWGFSDRSGRLVIPASFNGAGEFYRGLAPVQIGEHWGFITRTGRVAIPPRFDLADSFGWSGLAPVCVDNRWAYINRAGEPVTPFSFEDLTQIPQWGFYPYQHPASVFARAKLHGGTQEALVLPTGRVLGPFDETTEEMWIGDAPLAPVRVGRRWGFVNTQSRWVVPPEYAEVSAFHEGLACVLVKGRYGFINRVGHRTIAPRFDLVCDFERGLACVMVKGRWGVIDRRGRAVVRPQFEAVSTFYGNGLATFSANGRVGLIDRRGRVVLTPQYEEIIASDFGAKHALCAVKRGGLWGFLDGAGCMIVAPRFTETDGFDRGLARVVWDDQWGYLNRSGRMVWSGKKAPSLCAARKP